MNLLLLATLVISPYTQTFDVASIRSLAGQRPLTLPDKIDAAPGSVTMRTTSLAAAVAWAYNVRPYQVSGPDWIAQDRFDITAKVADHVPTEQMRRMMQTLMADRFGVKFHRETKTLSVFALTQAKGGTKCKETTAAADMSINPPVPGRTVGTIKGGQVSALVDFLYLMLKVPVIDKTGLTGRYDCNLDSASMENGDMVTTVMQGLQEQFGLKLESRKEPVDLLVIDHAQKVPTEN